MSRLELLDSMSLEERAAAEHVWEFWARPKQLAPAGSWTTWLCMGGRGTGKTRTGAEWVIKQARDNPTARIHIVGRTASDVQGVMLYGNSGIMSVSAPWFRPKHNPSKNQLTWPNGAIAKTFSADEPDSLRGPQCTHAWADEPAAWRFADAWDQLLLGLRLGDDPRVLATTTPRPTKFIRQLRAHATTVTTVESTYANLGNLAPTFREQIIARYEGTRLGRQELNGDILEDNPGALWNLDAIDSTRVKTAPDLRRVVVAIDPAVTSNEDSDETGIIVAGAQFQLDEVDGKSVRRLHGYVLDDVSGIYSPAAWAQRAVAAYRAHKADAIVAEVNNGGDMIESTIHSVDRSVRVIKVRASRGKEVRAEPIAALYEQKRVHHVGMLAQLEDQLVGWDPATAKVSPDRLDALVWAMTELVPNFEPTPTRGVIDAPVLPF